MPRPPAKPTTRRRAPPSASGPRHGVARVLSRLGLCSRSQAEAWVRAGRVAVNGRTVRDPEHPVREGRDAISLDGQTPAPPPPRYLMLNKPRGLVTTASDERGRDTVYRCFEGAELPWIAPVGRLDQASEGLLLFCNDPAWAAKVTDPASGPDKTYRVQVGGIPDATTLAAIEAGVVDRGEHLAARSARLLQQGQKNAWLELVLDEGRNRHIRRLLAALDLPLLRLIRVAVGPLVLGELPKGAWRELAPEEVLALAPPTR
jgi:23S rRNA pseudouridine2605 synthase